MYEATNFLTGTSIQISSQAHGKYTLIQKRQKKIHCVLYVNRNKHFAAEANKTSGNTKQS